MPEIVLKDLNATYINKKTKEETIALSNVSTSFASNSINVVIGPSGSGKTTLLKCVAGLLDYEGLISFDGVDVRNIDISNRNIAYVSQQYALYPHMTIFDNMAFPLKAVGAGKEEIIASIKEISNTFGLSYLWGRKPKELSGGQQQRVALARAIVKHPLIYLFDEPLSNVSSNERIKEREFIKDVIKKYCSTSIYVTHSINEAFALSDCIYVLNEGKIIEVGPKEKIRLSTNPIVRGILNAGYDSI